MTPSASESNKFGKMFMTGLCLLFTAVITLPILFQAPNSSSLSEAAFRGAIAAPWLILGIANFKHKDSTFPPEQT